MNHEAGHCLNIGHDGHDDGDLMAAGLSADAGVLLPTDRDIELVRHRYIANKP